MGKKARKKGHGANGQADKAKERGERARLRKERQRNQGMSCSDADDKEFEAQVEQIGCKIKFIAGDGNCLFRSLADQLEGKPGEHAAVRAQVMNHLEANRETFEPYMEDDEAFSDYLLRMRGDAEWGGHQELVAASQLFKANIVVHQFKAPRFFIPCEKARLTIHLSYHGEYHYNSVRALGDEGNGPALPITLLTPSPGRTTLDSGSRETGGSSPWAEQITEVARSCPWASLPNIAKALETTGGRGDDAIELLIAERNEPALAESEDGDEHDRTETVTGQGRAARGAQADIFTSDGPEAGRNEMGRPGQGLANGQARQGAKGDAAGKPNQNTSKIRRRQNCPCGSGLKHRKCCKKKDSAIARGQNSAPQQSSEPTIRSDARLADDLGSLRI